MIINIRFGFIATFVIWLSLDCNVSLGLNNSSECMGGKKVRSQNLGIRS